MQRRKPGQRRNSNMRAFKELHRARQEEPRTFSHRDDKNTVHPHEVFDLSDTKVLKNIQNLKSFYEKAVAEVLLEMGLEVKYEARNFEIDKCDRWPPDFFIDLFVNGKQVAIETHNLDFLFIRPKDSRKREEWRSEAAKHYLERMGKFLENHGEHVYLILIDSHIVDEKPAYIEFESDRIVGNGKSVDEHWHMRKIPGMGKKENVGEYEAFKEDLRVLLLGLIERTGIKSQLRGAD